MKPYCKSRTTYSALTGIPAALGKNTAGTLVIVDMQPGFVAGCVEPRLLERAVLAEIEQAKKRKWAIVVLELRPNQKGATLKRIREAIVKYRLAVVTRKKADDGSKEVIKTCSLNRFSTHNYKVVGVYTDACVEGTAFGLLDRLPHSMVTVVKGACSTNTPEGCWENLLARQGRRCVVA
jgi:nicotinamidase-related amidase